MARPYLLIESGSNILKFNLSIYSTILNFSQKIKTILTLTQIHAPIRGIVSKLMTILNTMNISDPSYSINIEIFVITSAPNCIGKLYHL